MSNDHVGTVSAIPGRWPVRGCLDDATVGLCMIDFQHDFCSPGGFADRQGHPIDELQSARKAARPVLMAARRAGWTIVHTRVGRSEAMLEPESEWSMSPVVGARGPLGRHLVRGHAGYEIVEDLAPAPGEVVIDKVGKGAFHATELDLVLRRRGVTHLVFAGVTSDVCVLSTFREAHDRGYECLVLSDATGTYDASVHAAAMELVTTQDGILGSRATVGALLDALR